VPCNNHERFHLKQPQRSLDHQQAGPIFLARPAPHHAGPPAWPRHRHTILHHPAPHLAPALLFKSRSPDECGPIHPTLRSRCTARALAQTLDKQSARVGLQRNEWYRHVTLVHQTAAEQGISENNAASAQKSTSENNALVPWPPFAAWLETFAEAMKDDFLYYGEDDHCSVSDMASQKMNMLTELECVVVKEKEVAREGLEGVLEAMDLCGFERELKRCLEKVEAEVERDTIERRCFDEGGEEFGY
jgi:hypothetical protein